MVPAIARTDPEPTPDPVVLTDTYTSGDGAVSDSEEFNIKIDFYGEWDDVLKDDFINSADFLSSLITNDIVPDGYDYDDLTISATLTEIDGVGGILGRAGPTAVWDTNGVLDENDLTSQAIMEFDVADAQTYESLGLWDDIVLHEMIHTLGFGTLWDYHNLLETTIDDNGTRKPVDDTISSIIFTGEMATYYNDGVNPLVETDGGEGTAYGHWDEETYENELMTGYIDDPNYLSQMSYGALDDMGYDINYLAIVEIA